MNKVHEVNKMDRSRSELRNSQNAVRIPTRLPDTG